ncbi:protein ntm1-like 9 [Fagus crenata]
MDMLSEEMLQLFRFSPTDKEVMEQILKRKITGNDKEVWCIGEIEFYKHEPWDLPHFSGIATKDREWFFFTLQERKHQNRNWTNRATKAGYWKSTGDDKKIYSGESLIGMKKILVFHIGQGTRWVMHEYRTTLKEYDGTKPGQKALVLCRLFEKKETKKKSKSALAHVSPALEVQAQTHITSNPSCDAEMSDATICDASAPVECNNDNNNDHNAYVAENQVTEVTSSEVDEQLEEGLNMFFVPYPEEQDNLFPPPSLPPISPAVSTPFKDNSSHEETRSEPTLTPASQVLWKHAEKHPINAYAQDNQVAEAKATESESELQEMLKGFYVDPPGPLE